MLFYAAFLALHAPLTAPEILQRSQKAYDAARTFEQNVTGEIGGSKGTARIAFVRPGRLRVGGSTLFGRKYDLLADGKSTWVLNGGSWNPVQNAEMGIATITGISAMTGTFVPGTLLRLTSCGLFPETGRSHTVKIETVKGRKFYRLTSAKPFPETLWIDATTFFVARTEADLMGRKSVVTFAPPKVNGTIPASRFQK